MIDQDRAENTLGFGQNVLQGFFHVLLGIGESDHANGGRLPDIVKIQLGHGDVEFAAEAILEAAKDLALVLEGASVRDVKLQCQQTDWHGGESSGEPRHCEKKALFTGGGARAGLRGGFGTGNFLDVESFENVANFHVVEIGDAGTAFKTGTDFAGVVLKAFERAEL